MGIFSKSKHETPSKGGADEVSQETAVAGSMDAEPEHTILDSDGEAVKDILLQVPLAEIHKVEDNTDTLLEKGSLVAYGVTFPASGTGSGASMMALEVNETRWWLRPDMATLKVAPMSYMMDVSSPDATTKMFFCITFAEDTLPEAVGTFEGLLEETTQYAESEKLLEDPEMAKGDFAIAEGLKFTNKAASTIHSASCKVAGGILMGASAASKALMDHSARVQANSEPGKARPVPGPIKASASMTRTGTKLLSKTAGRIVNAVATVPVYVAEKMVGSKPAQPGQPGQELRQQSATKQVATAGAVSFTVVYESLEQGAKVVLTGARDSAAGVAGHKWGPDAGQLTSDTLASAGHTVNAYTSYRNIAVRAIARTTAKRTAKNLLYGYLGKDTGQTGTDFKAQAKASVQQHAKNLKQTPQQSAGSGSSAHHVMLKSHSSRLSPTRSPASASAQESVSKAV